MSDDTEDKPVDRKCDRCFNWLRICGHDLPFTERMKSIALPTSWAKDSH